MASQVNATPSTRAGRVPKPSQKQRTNESQQLPTPSTTQAVRKRKATPIDEDVDKDKLSVISASFLP